MKKRRELFNNGIPPDKLKIRNFELFNDGKKVVLIDKNEKNWLTFLHGHAGTEYSKPLEKFLNAIILSQYNVICLCETWLHGGVSDSELQLKEYNLYRADRPFTKDYSTHGGSLIAVESTLVSKQLDIVLPECCVACTITLDNLEIGLCILYNPPDDSKYRHEISDFEQILNSLPKTTPLIVCGDMKLSTIDWNTLCSSDDYEQRVIDLFDHHMLRQVVDFPTCTNNTINLVFQRKSIILAEKDNNFTKVYNITFHHAVKMRLECSHHQHKPIFEKYRSYGRADYQKIIDIMSTRPFSPVCHTNINNMYSELCQYTENLIQECVPLRTRHRQEMPPWKTPSTSNLINKLKTQKKVLLERPTAYRKKTVSKLENVVIKNCEIDHLNYQEELLSSHNTEKSFKHLNYLNKANCITKVMCRGDEVSRSENETARFFNEFFHSIYSPKIPYTLQDIRNERSVLTNFDVSRSKVRSILTDLDITKSRGPNNFPPVLFKKTAVEMSSTLNKLFKNVRRLRTLPS